MTLHTSIATALDLEAVARLEAHSFPDANVTADQRIAQLRDPRFGGGIDSLVVGEAGGEIVASCQVHPLRQWLGRTALPVAGVGTVSVSPTHRKRGFAAQLVTDALRIARQRGDVGSALYPFRASFYRTLGYGQAGTVEQYHVPVQALPASEHSARVELLPGDAAEAAELYARWAMTQTGQLVRNAPMWTALCGAPARHTFGYRAEDGTLEGYARVVYRNELPLPQRYLDVEELVWTTDAARRGLYGWLATLGDQWQHVLVRALPSHRMSDWLSEARLPFGTAPSWNLWGPAAILLTGPMFRIVDVAGAFERRRLAAQTSHVFVLEIADAQLPENAGEWTLTLERGHARVTRGASGGGLRIGTDIGTLSRLYAGALHASAAHAAGLLECNDARELAVLDEALAVPEYWLFDRF